MVGRKGMLAGLFVFLAWAQTTDKVLYFTHLDTQQAMREVVNVIRSVGDTPDVSLNFAKRSITVKGTADQIAMTSWLTAELDKTDSPPGTRELPVQDASAPLAQILYLTHVDDPREMQEIVNVARSVVEIQRVFPMVAQRALVMRGSPEQLKVADWLVGVLDQPPNRQNTNAPRQYRLSASDFDSRAGLVVQVVEVNHLDSPQAIQDATNVIRSIVDVQRCFPVFAQRSLVMRADDEQMVLADWLLKLLDGSPTQGMQEFKVGGPGNQVAQVAYLSAATPQRLQEEVNEIRRQTALQRVFPFYHRAAIVLRGTPDQLAIAQQVIQARNGR